MLAWLQTDFLLVLLHDMVQAFPDLHVILMSATIDTTLFCDYFTGCHVIEVYGRVHPVQGCFLFSCYQYRRIFILTEQARSCLSAQLHVDSQYWIVSDIAVFLLKSDVKVQPTIHSVLEMGAHLTWLSQCSQILVAGYLKRLASRIFLSFQLCGYKD